jgi:hypothetical protein
MATAYCCSCSVVSCFDTYHFTFYTFLVVLLSLCLKPTYYLLLLFCNNRQPPVSFYYFFLIADSFRKCQISFFFSILSYPKPADADHKSNTTKSQQIYIKHDMNIKTINTFFINYSYLLKAKTKS